MACVFTAELINGYYEVKVTNYSDYVNKGDDPWGTLAIGAYAFYKCNELTSITFPRRTGSIGECAFEQCEKLQTVTFDFGHRVKQIGHSAFKQCNALEVVDMQDGVETIGAEAFYFCPKLRSCNLGDGLQKIGSHAFDNCGELRSVLLPASLWYIGKYAFYGVPTDTYGTQTRYIEFEDATTWVVTDDPNASMTGEISADDSSLIVLPPKDLYGSGTNNSNVEYNGHRLGFHIINTEKPCYAGFTWIKLYQMLTPKVQLNGDTLSMTDPLGLAEAFNIWVDETDTQGNTYKKLKCTVRM
jgi:hypothetical protein